MTNIIYSKFPIGYKRNLNMIFPEKLVLIGVDGAILDFVVMLMNKGKLPNIANIAQKGVLGSVLSPYPTITTPNWTSIATGAWPGTHGITDYFVHHPGESLDVIYSGFNTKECSAEYLWDTAEKAGKKVILMKYSASWPPTIKKGIQVDGCGPGWPDEKHEICDENLFTNLRGYPFACETELKPSSKEDKLIGRLKFTPHSHFKDLKPAFLYAILDPKDNKNKRLIISRSQMIEEQVTNLSVGEWGDWVDIEFKNGNGNENIRGLTRFKLIELSEDTERFRIYATHVMPEKGWTIPELVGSELLEKYGGFIQRPGWEGRTRGWIDNETFLELVDYQNNWMADASIYLMKKYGCDVFLMQTHSPDYAHHLFQNNADPLTNSDNDSLEDNLDCLISVYESVDRMIGKIMESVDKKTLVAVVSDHGAQTHDTNVNIHKILVAGGFLSLIKDKYGKQVIDWNNTRAAPQRTCHIYVNLKGRDPYGIVQQGEDYEKIRDEIIDLLMNYRDDSGKCPFNFVWKREDARILGLYSDKVGDIIYALKPGFGGEHGQQLPTTKYGQFGSLDSLFAIAGPGIKVGAKIKPTRWLIDLAPTFSYLLGIPVPKDADGSIMYEILQDPQGRLKERKDLEREAENWRNSYEKMQGLIHIA
jgi:predicted AlkP superfamily phosphohydrolase/phosphomutase